MVSALEREKDSNALSVIEHFLRKIQWINIYRKLMRGLIAVLNVIYVNIVLKKKRP